VKLFTNPPDDLADIPAFVPKILGNTALHMGMNEDQQREALRAYYAAITFMDDQLGRVLRTLEALKLRQNTLVVFMSDHGWHLGEHSFWQKRSLMEESTKVPFIVSAPGRKARNKVCRSLTELVDLYPTVASLAGLTPPANLEGQSLVPLLDDPRRAHKTMARTQLNAGKNTGRAVRTADFRYIQWKGEIGSGEELYDHRRDPHEFRNLAADPAYATELTRHRAMVSA
jgi:iduronate 2-sulfatase